MTCPTLLSRVPVFIVLHLLISLKGTTLVGSQALCQEGQADEGSGCVTCPTGKYQNQNDFTESCKFCEAGKKFATKATACVNCLNGQYQEQNNQESASCAKCFPGEYAFQAGLAQCSLCPVGWARNKSGAVLCEGCTIGLYTGCEGRNKKHLFFF